MYGRRFPVLVSEPSAKLDNLRLVACEINVFCALEEAQHIQIVGQFPIILIHAALGGEVRRVKHEQGAAVPMFLPEQFAVVGTGNLQTVQIAVTVVVGGLGPVVHRVPAQLLQRVCPFP